MTPPPIDTDIAGEEGKIAKAKMLDELSESRPLAKLQRELEETANGAAGEAVSTTDEKDSADSNGGPSGTEASTTEVQKAASVGEATLNKSTTPPGSPAKARKPLLNPYDSELVRVSNVSIRCEMCNADGRSCHEYIGASTLLMRRERIDQLLHLYR